jgi:hypothetical protein
MLVRPGMACSGIVRHSAGSAAPNGAHSLSAAPNERSSERRSARLSASGPPAGALPFSAARASSLTLSTAARTSAACAHRAHGRRSPPSRHCGLALAASPPPLMRNVASTQQGLAAAAPSVQPRGAALGWRRPAAAPGAAAPQRVCAPTRWPPQRPGSGREPHLLLERGGHQLGGRAPGLRVARGRRLAMAPHAVPLHQPRRQQPVDAVRAGCEHARARHRLPPRAPGAPQDPVCGHEPRWDFCATL